MKQRYAVHVDGVLPYRVCDRGTDGRVVRSREKPANVFVAATMDASGIRTSARERTPLLERAEEYREYQTRDR